MGNSSQRVGAAGLLVRLSDTAELADPVGTGQQGHCPDRHCKATQ